MDVSKTAILTVSNHIHNSLLRIASWIVDFGSELLIFPAPLGLGYRWLNGNPPPPPPE